MRIRHEILTQSGVHYLMTVTLVRELAQEGVGFQSPLRSFSSLKVNIALPVNQLSSEFHHEIYGNGTNLFLDSAVLPACYVLDYGILYNPNIISKDSKPHPQSQVTQIHSISLYRRLEIFDHHVKSSSLY